MNLCGSSARHAAATLNDKTQTLSLHTNPKRSLMKPIVFIALLFSLYAAPILATDPARAITKYGFMSVQGYPFASTMSQKSIPDKKQQTEDETWENILKNMTTSFSLPLSDLGKKDAATDGVSIGLGFSLPLKAKANPTGTQTQGERLVGTSFSASITYTPLSYWFISVSFMKYLNEGTRNPWDPDFSYRFGYDDWHPYTFSLVYWSTVGNKFNASENRGKITHLSEGTWTLGWKFPAAKFYEQWCTLDESSAIGHSLSLNLTPTYTAGVEEKSWKTSLCLGTKYTIYKSFYLTFSLYYYPIAGQQQDWDPDFTYGFGYFDWHSNTITVQYNNYAGNRYPWRSTSASNGSFLDGSLSLSWSYSF